MAVGEVVIRVSYPDFILIENALVHARAHRGTPQEREQADRAYRHLESMRDQVPMTKPARLKLRQNEYDIMMETLEFFVADERGSSTWLPTFNLWERFLAEGGHASPKEIQALRRRYGYARKA